MRGGWGEAEIVWFESGCVICRAADHAEATGHPCRWDVLGTAAMRRNAEHVLT